ncbi:MAG: tetratricopeptide repeat protein, partial [Alcanivoracaceae bacterium]
APGSQPAGENRVDSLGAFRENWILSELRSIRSDMMEYRTEMQRIVIDRELEVADKAMGYATNTVTYFFYLIAGAASILALVGWSTIRDLKDNIRVYAEREMSRLTAEYEQRLADLEKELRRKSRTISANQEEIERTNEIHSLWLKVSKETTPEGKIGIYDQILELRPEDHEAMGWKADAVLELGEHRWALNLCDEVLAADSEDSQALYQRACAHMGLGEHEQALDDLAMAIASADSLRDLAREETFFEPLRDDPRFLSLLGEGAA